MGQLEYRHVLLPLGIPSWSRESPKTWKAVIPVHVVSELTVIGDYSASQVSAWLDANPVWLSNSLKNVPIAISWAPAYEDSIAGHLSPKFSVESIRKSKRLLARYLSRPNGLSAGSTHYAERLPHDPRYDALTHADFSDTPKFFSQTIPQRDAWAFIGALAAVGASDANAGDLSACLDLDTRLLSAVNSFLMEEIVADQFSSLDSPGPFAHLVPMYRRSLPSDRHYFRDSVKSLLDRVHGYDKRDPRARKLDAGNQTISETDLKRLVETGDPNVFISSALKDPFLAKALGLVTSWEAEIGGISGAGDSHPSNVEVSLALALPKELVADITYVTQPTIARLGDEVSPSPRNSALGMTGGLAWLNGRANENNYRALQVDADSELMKAWILQSSNTLSTASVSRTPSSGIRTDPGGPPPVFNDDELQTMRVDPRIQNRRAELSRERAKALVNSGSGINEPSTPGVTFSASLEDLVPTQRTIRGDPNALYLEDLWVGYRINVARKTEAASVFRSLHKQNVVVEFAGGESVSGESEGYIDREQLSQDRPSSTEFCRWTGIGNAQHFPLSLNKSGGKALDTSGHPTDLNPSQTPYRATVEAVAGSLPRLWYPNSYQYFIRNVFTGGLSLTSDEAESLLTAPSSRQSRFPKQVQDFGFFRTEALTPGVLLLAGKPEPSKAATERPASSEQTVYLTEYGDCETVFLAPKPLDIQQARFIGLIGSPTDDRESLADFGFFDQLRRHLIGADGEILERTYFLDKDVERVVARCYSLTRNPSRPPRDEMIGTNECTVTFPWRFAWKEMSFSDAADWKSFRPIKFRFVAVRPKSGFHRGLAADDETQKNSHELQINIPPGEAVDISIIPSIGREGIQKSYIYQNARQHLSEHQQSVVPPILPVIAERRIRAIHATRRPLESPHFEFDLRYLVREDFRAGPQPTFRMPRHGDGNKAYIVGGLTVHAPTTGETFFIASWTDIDDDPNRTKYALVPGHHRTSSRSVRFETASPPSSKEVGELFSRIGDRSEAIFKLRDRVAVVCAENILRFDAPSSVVADGQPNGDASKRQYNVVELGDGRRRLLMVQAFARGRYANLYPSSVDSDFERASDVVFTDVPNREVPPGVHIKSVLPTFRDRVDKDPSGKETLISEVGLRIYVRRPIFGKVGVGARCAIGVLEADDYARQRLRPFGTLWGEDPLEHPKLPVTTRLPRASDFTAPVSTGDMGLDEVLYPRSSLIDRDEVHYDRLDHPIERQGVDKFESVNLSVASFALRYDDAHGAYYFDVIVKEGFIGWLRLSIYCHQPHSIPGCELTPSPTHVYTAVIHDAPIVHYQEDDWWTVRIGPCFDRTIDFVGYEAEQVSDGSLTLLSEGIQFVETTNSGGRYFALRLGGKRRLICVHKKRGEAILDAILI